MASHKHRSRSPPPPSPPPDSSTQEEGKEGDDTKVSSSGPIVLDETTISSWRKQHQQNQIKYTPKRIETQKRQIKAMKKWGIPVKEIQPPEYPSDDERFEQQNQHQQQDHQILLSDTPETILLARLIWVKYDPHYHNKNKNKTKVQTIDSSTTTNETNQQKRHNYYLWPAIYYKNYREIACEAPKLWHGLGLFGRLPIASRMVFDRSNPSNHVPVCRLLGMAKITLVELPESKPKQQSMISEFHCDLPNMLKDVACNIDYFRYDPILYYDWHRALDQVEILLKECLGDHYVLSAEPTKQVTWYQRAVNEEFYRWRQDMSPKVLISRCSECSTGCGGGTGVKDVARDLFGQVDDDIILDEDDELNRSLHNIREF